MTAEVHTSRLRRRQHGVAMVEFTIVLASMLLLTVGVTELGRGMVRYNALTKAVRDGARHASAHALLGTTGTVNIDAQLVNEVRNVVVYGNFAGGGTPILSGLQTSQVSLTAGGVGEVRVDAAYPYTGLFGASLPSFGFSGGVNANFTMRASVSMRAL